jgi:hypothetical protein
MKKRLIVLGVCISGFFGNSTQALAQPNVNAILTTQEAAYNAFIANPRNLVSSYNFRKLIRNDFSVLLTGSQNNASVGRYAAVNIDKNEQAFKVSPFNYTFRHDPLKGPFNLVVATDFSGSINSNNAFDFKGRKKFSYGLSITYVNGRYNHANKPSLATYASLYSEVKAKLVAAAAAASVTAILDNGANFETDYEVQKAYAEKVAEYENKLVKKKWSNKFIWWTKVGFNITQEYFNYIDTNTVSTYLQPLKREHNRLSIPLSVNAYFVSRTGISSYFSFSGTITQKSSYSEILTSQEWNSVKPISTGISIGSEKQSVYLTDDKFFKKIFMDWGFQFIGFMPEFQGNTLGIDLQYNTKPFITPGTKTSKSIKNVYSFGIIFPFKDKDGKSSVNLEPFYEFTSYTNYDAGVEKTFWGLKFSLPFTQLF